MPVWVDSNAVGANNGTSFTDAYTSITSALPGLAGDEIRVSSAHVEGHTGSNLILGSNGTVSNPIIVVSTNSADETYLRGATLDASGSLIDVSPNSSGYTRWYGVDFKAQNDIRLNTTGISYYFEDCDMYLTGTVADTINMAGTNTCRHLVNCRFHFASAAQYLNFAGSGVTILDRISHVSGTTLITGGLLGGFNTNMNFLRVMNSDFSGLLSTTGPLFKDLPTQPSDGHGHQFELSNIKLGSSQVISNSSFAEEWSEIRAFNVEVGTGNNEFMVENYRGKATQEETIVRNATHDGTNKYSVKMVANTNSIEFIAPFKMEVIGPFFAAANSTIRVDFVHDSQGDGTSSQMQNDEFWLELAHPTLNSAQHTVLTKRKADYRAANADVQSGAGSGWTTTGLTTPVSEQCTFTVTGGAAGMHYITAYLANAATETTVYVDPEPTVT